MTCFRGRRRKIRAYAGAGAGRTVPICDSLLQVGSPRPGKLLSTFCDATMRNVRLVYELAAVGTDS